MYVITTHTRVSLYFDFMHCKVTILSHCLHFSSKLSFAISRFVTESTSCVELKKKNPTIRLLKIPYHTARYNFCAMCLTHPSSKCVPCPALSTTVCCKTYGRCIGRNTLKKCPIMRTTGGTVLYPSEICE